MLPELLRLRERQHQGEFHFDLEPELWRRSYLERPGVSDDTVITVRREGQMRAYAVCALAEFGAGAKAFQVLEFCAEDKEVMAELLNQITDRAREKDADVITITRHHEPFADLLQKHGFIDSPGYVVLAALLNVRELLSAFSEEGVSGRTLCLVIAGFDPVYLIIGANGVKLLDKAEKADVTLEMSDKTFINLFFNRTIFIKELLKGNVKIKGLAGIGIAMRLFAVIKQKRIYIPPGDGI